MPKSYSIALSFAASLVAFVVPALVRAQITTGDVERALPPGSMMVREVQGGGAQIYTCNALAGAYVWTLTAPQAVLIDDDGTYFGVHGAGPKWTANDGSAIAADSEKPLAKIVRPGQLPALLLPVTVSTGHGELSGVLYVSRTNTMGGLPPDTACDADHAGMSSARHYSAVYRFFK